MIRRTLVALAFIGFGWAAAQAQNPVVADFEVSVVTSYETGQITIECVRGCGLQFGRLTPSRADAQKSFTYGPCGRTATTCGSGPLHGWVTR
jgi:hypothetical protein